MVMLICFNYTKSGTKAMSTNLMHYYIFKAFRQILTTNITGECHKQQLNSSSRQDSCNLVSCTFVVLKRTDEFEL